MINYTEKQEYIVVKWKRTEIGRIYWEESYVSLLEFDKRRVYHYRPRGCEGKIESERFNKLSDLKRHIEGVDE